MAEVKWIKIVTDIFDDEKILLIESLPDADSIIVIWFKLLCLAGKQNNSGVFMMGNTIPYTDTMLATIFRRKESTVRMALKVFKQFGMIEIIDGVITIPNWKKHQNLDAIESRNKRQREYMAEYRKKQKLLIDSKANCNANSNANSKANCNANVSFPEEDIEEDIEEDKIYRSTAGMNPGGESHEKPKKAEGNPAYKEIVDYLNTVCGTEYRASSKETQRLISARLHEGFTVEDFKSVIRTKHAEWANDAKMRKFLRPETLFGTKFESYLNQCAESRETSILDDVF